MAKCEKCGMGDMAEKTGEKCDKCGEGEFLIRSGQYGKFKACSRFPQCKNTKKIEAPAQ